jgi:6-phosphogluconolactonase (cycloisomerase 2 family)
VNSKTISAFAVKDASGALDSLGTTATDSNSKSVVVDPTGTFAYVANTYADTIATYGISASGALTLIGTPVGTGQSPGSIVIAQPN